MQGNSFRMGAYRSGNPHVSQGNVYPWNAREEDAQVQRLIVFMTNLNGNQFAIRGS